MKPVEVLNRLIESISIRSSRPPVGRALERWCSKKDREILKNLKSDDIADIRSDNLLVGKSHPDNTGRN